MSHKSPDDAGNPSPPAKPAEGKFLSDSLLTYGSEVLNSALLFLNGILIARVLGPEVRGVYAVVLLVPMTLFPLGHLGLFQGLVHGSVKDPAGIGPRVMNALAMALGLGGVLTMLGAIAYRSGFYEEWQLASPLALGMGLLGLPAVFMNTYNRALVLGQDDLVRRNILRVAEPLAYLAGALALLVGLRKGLDGAMIAWAASQWSASLLGLYFLLPTAAASRFRPDWRRLAADIRFGLQAYGGSVASFLLYKQDVFLVAYFLDSAAVGHYAVARTLMMMMGILPNAVQAAFLPKVTAEFYRTGGREEMTALVCRLMMILSLAMAVVAALLVYPAVGLLYGTAYLPAVGAFLIFLPSVTFLASLSALHASMQARGAQIWISVAAAVALVVNLGLDLLMIPAWGILGAACASSLSYLVMLTIVVAAFLKLEPDLELKELVVPRREDVALMWDSVGGLLRRFRRSG